MSRADWIPAIPPPITRAAIAKVNLDAPLQPGESLVTKRALVIGGGIAGIQSALDIAEAGYEVDILRSFQVLAEECHSLIRHSQHLTVLHVFLLQKW